MWHYIMFMSHRTIPMIAFLNYIHIYIYVIQERVRDKFRHCLILYVLQRWILSVHQTLLYHTYNTFLSEIPSVYIQAMCICRLYYKITCRWSHAKHEIYYEITTVVVEGYHSTASFFHWSIIRRTVNNFISKSVEFK